MKNSLVAISEVIGESIRTQEAMQELNPMLAKEHGFAVAELKRIKSIADNMMVKKGLFTPAWGADKIRVIVEDFGMPVAALSREIGISRTAIHKLLNGDSYPSQHTTDRVSELVSKIIKELES